MTPSRPVGIEEMLERQKLFVTEASWAAAARFQPGADEVFISPYSKCGTTWMQQIVHGLRTGGSMDFGEISEVVPWLELAHDLGQVLDAPQSGAPRAYKSHLRWNDIPKGGRYIVVFRDPLDAMLSLYKFENGWFFEPGSVSVAEFADFFLSRDSGECYWAHAQSWWAQRGAQNILLLTFEQLKADLPGAVARVADFIGITDTDARQIATRQADFAFMKKHGDQFDDSFLRGVTDRAMHLPLDSAPTKVSTGKTGQGRKEITPEIAAAFAAKWQETLGASCGLPDYAALRAALET